MALGRARSQASRNRSNAELKRTYTCPPLDVGAHSQKIKVANAPGMGLPTPATVSLQLVDHDAQRMIVREAAGQCVAVARAAGRRWCRARE
jgi:hypothetical protein